MHDLLTPDRLRRQTQPADTLLLWLPVFLMTGMGIYFALPREPATPLLVGLFVMAVVIALITARWRASSVWRWGISFAMAVTAGLVLAQLRTFQLSTPLLTDRIWSTTVTGNIVSAERASSGWRLVLANAAIGTDTNKNYTLRLSVRKKGGAYHMGGILKAQAGLMPPSPPFVPGMFDFQRHAFFQGISGYGYVMRVLSYTPPQEKRGLSLLERYREYLSTQAYTVLQQPEAGIVTALLNGQRAGIANKTTSLLQTSGLQHIISISGLHVGLMAGVVFYFVRLLLALNMRIALTWPIKKIAALAAIIAIVSYMFIVGLSPPTVRSVIMTGIVLFAVIVDREAINLRLVAIAALVILVLQPESVLDIGFQLSFSAVAGLVAFFQMTQSFWQHQNWQASVFMKLARVTLMTMTTALIATAATAPLTMAHFQTIPLLSVVANLLATPPVTFLIMPGTFLAYLFSPLPWLLVYPIKLMGWGTTLLLRVSDFVAALPVAVWRASAPPFMAVTFIMLGCYALLVGKGRTRLIGMVPMVIGIIWWGTTMPADMWLSSDRVIAIKNDLSDTLYIEGRAYGFQKKLLQQHAGVSKVVPLPCQSDICDQMIGKQSVRLVRTVEALPQACADKDTLIVTRYYLDQTCKGALILDRHVLDQQGGIAVWLQNKPPRMAFVRARGADRPWQQRPVLTNRWKFRKKAPSINQENKGLDHGETTDR